jgi:glycosyltransferase involved in cell wall biosynthesis
MITRYHYDGIPVWALDKNYQPHATVRETYWQETMRPHLRRVLEEVRPDIVHVTHLINHTAVLLEEAARLGCRLVATLTDFFGFCYNNKLEAADGELCAGPNRLRSNCIACHLKASGVPASPSGHGRDGMRARAAFGLARFRGTPPDAVTDGAVTGDIVARPDVLKRAYRAYDAMIAPTLFLRDAYARNGFKAARLHLSRFGVDLDRREKMRLPAGTPLTVGYIGQIAAHKGVDLLLAAVGSLPAGTVRLLIHGPENQDPAYMARLRAMATPATEFRGTFAPARMNDVLAEMDMLAIPSTWYENSPLVLLNALASRTPVLVSDVRGLTEFIPDSGGWSFRRGDVADLTRVLADLAAHPERVREASATTRYDRTTALMAADVADIYRDVVQGARRGMVQGARH